MGRYVVVGGQYFRYVYGSTDSLLSAKRLAGKNDEYWDNWQGWHRPCIEDAEGGTLHYYNMRTKKWENEPMEEW